MRARKSLSLPIIFIVVLVSAVLSLGIKKAILSQSPGAGPSLYVKRVVDGDTLILSNGERVRLIGIDTPELHFSGKLLRDASRSHRDIKTIRELGRKASRFTREACLRRKVRLEFDAQKRDRYGRTLAYVYLDDGTFLNAEILRQGYGQIMTIPPNVKHADLFLKMERDARHNKRGLWKAAERKMSVSP